MMKTDSTWVQEKQKRKQISKWERSELKFIRGRGSTHFTAETDSAQARTSTGGSRFQRENAQEPTCLCTQGRWRGTGTGALGNWERAPTALVLARSNFFPDFRDLALARSFSLVITLAQIVALEEWRLLVFTCRFPSDKLNLGHWTARSPFLFFLFSVLFLFFSLPSSPFSARPSTLLTPVWRAVAHLARSSLSITKRKGRDCVQSTRPPIAPHYSDTAYFSVPCGVSLLRMRAQCSDNMLSFVRAELGTDVTLDWWLLALDIRDFSSILNSRSRIPAAIRVWNDKHCNL